MIQKVAQRIYEETYGFDLRWLTARFLMGFFPIFIGNRFRTVIMRLVGFKIGKGASFFGPPILTGGKKLYQKLVIGRDCYISIDVFFDLAAPIVLGNHVAIGPRSTLLTGAHEIGSSYYRVGPLTPKQITICDGAWLGVGVLVMPGITIGSGAVVAAGSVVTKDVPPNTLVAGVPAVVKRDLA